MFGIMSTLKNIVRYYKKSLIITLISIIIMLFVSYYIFLLNDGVNKMNFIYETTKIEASTNYKNGSSQQKYIPYEYMRDVIEKCKEIDKSYYQSIYDILLDKDNMEKITQIYATTDIKRELIFDKECSTIEYLEGYNDNSFCGKEAICIVSRDILNDNNWKIGDDISIYAPNNYINDEVISTKLKIVGAYDISANNTLTEFQLASDAQAVYCAFYPYAEGYKEFFKYACVNGQHRPPFKVNEAKYILKDAGRVENFREYIIQNCDFYAPASGIEDLDKYKIVIYDEELKQMLGGVKSVVFFLKIALPFVIAILAIIGFTISYLITQNRINDIALLRIMGIKRRKVFAMILNEMLLPCMVGGIISILVSQILYKNWFDNLPGVQFNLLLLISYIIIFCIGASVALFMILKLKPIQVLTKKE